MDKNATEYFFIITSLAVWCFGRSAPPNDAKFTQHFNTTPAQLVKGEGEPNFFFFSPSEQRVTEGLCVL